MTLSYFIDPYPLPLVPHATKLLITLLIAGACASAGFLVAARQLRHQPHRKRMVKRLLRWCVSVTCITALLFFFRQQRVYVLAMPAIALAIFIAYAAWLVYVLTNGVRTMRKEAQVWRAAEERKKYLS